MEFVSFRTARTYTIERTGVLLRMRPARMKRSRVTNLCSVFLHVGAQLPLLWERFLEDRVTLELDMGCIFTHDSRATRI